MTEKEAIKRHLSNNKEEENRICFSGFMAALRDARETTGRDPETGYYTGNEPKSGSWLGTIGYMALLDQIGKCFKPKDADNVAGNSYKKALKYFEKMNGMNDDDINALYALRNALMHDFSLSNVEPRDPYKDDFSPKKNGKHYIFSGTTDSDKIVEHAKEPWNGKYKDMKPENETQINLKRFGDMVEEIYEELIELYDEDNLEIALAGGADELIKRYSFCKAKPKPESEEGNTSF